MKQICVAIDAETRQRLDRLAHIMGGTRSGAARFVLRAALRGETVPAQYRGADATEGLEVAS